MLHQIIDSREADYTREQKLFVANVQQFAPKPSRLGRAVLSLCANLIGGGLFLFIAFGLIAMVGQS